MQHDPTLREVAQTFETWLTAQTQAAKAWLHRLGDIRLSTLFTVLLIGAVLVFAVGLLFWLAQVPARMRPYRARAPAGIPGSGRFASRRTISRPPIGRSIPPGASHPPGSPRRLPNGRPGHKTLRRSAAFAPNHPSPAPGERRPLPQRIDAGASPCHRRRPVLQRPGSSLAPGRGGALAPVG